MAKVSLNKAAKETGVSLPTLSRWRKKGMITADRNEKGGYLIDTSEYDRIQEFKKQSPNMKDSESSNSLNIATPNETPRNTNALEIEVQILRERSEDHKRLIEDLRTERDDWKKQAQTLLLTTTNQTQSEKTLEKPAEKRKKFLWWTVS